MTDKKIETVLNVLLATYTIAEIWAKDGHKEKMTVLKDMVKNAIDNNISAVRFIYFIYQLEIIYKQPLPPSNKFKPGGITNKGNEDII